MIAINEKEKAAIQARYPDMHFVRTVKQKSKRHHYYMTEEPRAMRLLEQIRYGRKPGGRKRGRHE